MYILKFKPLFMQKPWGGRKIFSIRGDVPQGLDNVGEMWSISAVHGNVTDIANGYYTGIGLDTLVQEQGAALLGQHVVKTFGNVFPMLIKLIDAAENLSVQVHPNDTDARRLQGVSQQSKTTFGKTEMWYILKRDEGASLIDGFNRALPPAEYRQRVEDNTFMDYLHIQPVEPGDVYFIPSGRVHGIGAGVFLAEIQQSSDITYRIYDYGRPRELHTDQAEQVIDFSAVEKPRSEYEYATNKMVNVVESQYFSTSVVEVEHATRFELASLDSFSIIMCTEGKMIVTSDPVSAKDADYCAVTLNTYECCLVPAEFNDVTIVPLTERARALHTYMP